MTFKICPVSKYSFWILVKIQDQLTKTIPFSENWRRNGWWIWDHWQVWIPNRDGIRGMMPKLRPGGLVAYNWGCIIFFPIIFFKSLFICIFFFLVLFVIIVIVICVLKFNVLRKVEIYQNIDRRKSKLKLWYLLTFKFAC